MVRLKKGSAAAKRHMARLRAMRGTKRNRSFKSKTRATKQRVRKRESKKKVRPMARRRRRRPAVKRRRSRRSGSGRLGSLMSKETFLLGVGAGSSGALGGYVKKYAPQVPDNYAEAAAAVILYLYGSKVHSALKTVGKGCMIKVVGDFVETNVMPQVLKGGPQASGGDF